MRTVRTPSGAEVERIVIEHPGAVAVVPLVGDDILLIEQYRTPADAMVLEVPAGKLDEPGEDGTKTARRELEEETGWVPGHLEYLSTIWTAVGFTDEQIAIYLATRLEHGTRTPVGEEEEASRVVRMPFGDAKAMVLRGEIQDAKSVAGILLADQHRGAT